MLSSWYITFIDILDILFILVMTRRMIYRGRMLLHTFQLSGYKIREFWHWLKNHWMDHVISLEQGLMDLVVMVAFTFFRSKITESAITVILLIFTLVWMGPVSEFRRKQKKPLVFTSRMSRLAILFAILAAILPVYGTILTLTNSSLYLDIYTLGLTWIQADILLPFWLLLAGFIMMPFEHYVHNQFKQMARKKLASMPNLMIIAITGSYGKTSTKFMIRDLLKERYNVLATPGSYNTPMGICKVINQDLQASHQILVLEMGARYRGNIRELCEIARPNISVVTNIGLAHLETFGSQEGIRETKSEIVQYMKQKGTVVLNADDPLVMTMADIRDDATILTAGFENGDFKADQIRYDQNGCTFRVTDPEQQSVEVRLQLLGKHNVHDLLLAMTVGHHLGLRLRTMVVAASNIQPVEHRLQLKQQDGITILDDAFNSNPVGARNAVDILAQFNGGRRILITPGMVELGEAEYEENKNWGSFIGTKNLDLVVLVGPERTKPIHDGLKQEGFDGERVRVVKSLFAANEIISEFAQKGDTILYENDLPDTYNE